MLHQSFMKIKNFLIYGLPCIKSAIVNFSLNKSIVSSWKNSRNNCLHYQSEIIVYTLKYVKK